MSVLQYLKEELSHQIIAYHGSHNNFDKFKTYHGGSWFSADKDLASEYTDTSYTGKDARILYTVKLDIKNPYIFDAGGSSFEELHIPELYRSENYDDEDYDEDAYLEWDYDTDDLLSWALSEGYDSVIIHNVSDAPLNGSLTEPATIYGVGNPDMIKIIDKKRIH